MNPSVYTLSPSDCAYLFRECSRCFWLKVKHGVQQPRMPFPSVFNKIDGAMKERISNSSLIEFVPNAPSGARVHSFDGRVESIAYQSPNGGPGIRIKGIYDSLLALDSGFCLVDLKTVQPSPKLGLMFFHQLSAYAFALENPAIDENRLAPISRFGLICFGPTRFTSKASGDSALIGVNSWVEVERNDEAFFNFLDEVADLLASETPPESGKYCSTCQYLERISKFNESNSGFEMAVKVA